MRDFAGIGFAPDFKDIASITHHTNGEDRILCRARMPERQPGSKNWTVDGPCRPKPRAKPHSRSARPRTSPRSKNRPISSSTISANSVPCPTIHPSQSAQRRADAREAESAGLRRLEKTSPSLDQERPAAEPRHQGYKAQIDELQNQLNDKDSQLNEKNTELKHLRAEITCLLGRLNDAEESAKQIEAGVQQHLEPLNQEIAALNSRLTQQEETIQVKNNALKKLEMSHRASVTVLEQQARELDTQIQSQEAQLKEKLDIIQATAKKEAEMGNLIKRLSSECQKLSLELQEKTRRLNELEGKKPQAAVEAGAWRRAIGRLQEEGI
jgi:DNA repair exonuclease SbcCD ATPase subunit